MNAKGYLIVSLVTAALLAFLYFQDPGHIQITWMGFQSHVSVIIVLMGFLALFLGYKVLRSLLCGLQRLFLHCVAFFQRFYSPSDQEDLLKLARLSLEAKAFENARSYLMLLVKKAPSPEAYYLLAILELEENQNPQSAIEWLEKSISTPFKQ